MPEISKIKLPSGNIYDIKDAVARQAIAGGMTKIIAWNGTSTPTVANIPAGVVVSYGGQNYTGTLAVADADQTGFYFVYSNTQTETLDVYDEYTIVEVGGVKKWEKIGDTRLDLSSLGELAYKDNVTASPSAVSFSGGTTDTFVKSYPGATSKLQTTTVPNVTGNTDVSIPNVTGNTDVTIPNVTSAGSASTWGFALGTGDDAETLIISGGNGTAPTLGAALSASKVTLGTALSASKVTLGTAKTVATGSVASNGGGATVMTGLGTPTTESAVTSIGTGTAAAQNLTIS